VVVVIVEIFPTRVRYSGASIGYNLGYMIFGGTAPIVATYLVSATGSDAAPAIYLIVVALLVFPAVFLLPETRGLALLREGEAKPEVGPDTTRAQPS
jgi:MFS transporter, MHS family, proline/betaine transporter